MELGDVDDLRMEMNTTGSRGAFDLSIMDSSRCLPVASELRIMT
jgi:hypothetical protein